MRDRVPFLEHYVSREGVEVDPMKTSAEHDWHTPHTVKAVHTFFGVSILLQPLHPQLCLN